MPLALYSWAWLCRSRLRSPVTVTRFGLQPVRVTTPTARFCHLSASQVKDPNEQGKIAKWPQWKGEQRDVLTTAPKSSFKVQARGHVNNKGCA